MSPAGHRGGGNFFIGEGNVAKRSKVDGGGREDEGLSNEAARRANERSDTADAFLPDPLSGAPSRTSDDLAEHLAEDFVRSATTGEDAEDESMDQLVPEEYGGPFVETSADEEFAMGEDESNPEDAFAEPLPRAIHGLTSRPRE